MNDTMYVNVGTAKLSATHKSISLKFSDGRTFYIGLEGLKQVMSGARENTSVAYRNP